MAWDHRYLPLKEGEIIKRGDEILLDSGEWREAIVAGVKAPNPNYTSHRQYRRLKA